MMESKQQFSILIAVANSSLAVLTLGFNYDYQIIRVVAFVSFFLFAALCWLERSNILFLARTFILGFIGYFPMIIKATLGQEALFSGYEGSTQGFDIVVLMYVMTSFALLSNQIGLELAKQRSFTDFYSDPENHKDGEQKFINYWWFAGLIGAMLAVASSWMFVQGYGQTILTADYASAEQGGSGVAFGSAVVLGVVGIFSLFIAGMKGYLENWKVAFFIVCFMFIVYSQLLMGLRQDAMSTLFGILVLYGVVNKKEIGLKLSYVPVLIVAYIFIEAWGVARFSLASGVPISDIVTLTFTSIGATDAIRMGTVSPIATTFSNTVWLIQNNIIDYSWGRTYWEWILRIPPEILFPDRPVDYAWMFQEYGLLTGGGFFELAEVYMNFGLLGALVLPGIVSFLMAKSYYYAFYRQSMLSYFLLFSFLAIFLRGTWYQTFAFFRAFLVCILFYFVAVLISSCHDAFVKSQTELPHGNDI